MNSHSKNIVIRIASLFSISALLLLGFQNCGSLGSTGASISGQANTSSSESPSASANGSTIPSDSQLIDSGLNVWTLRGEQIYENGVVSPLTRGVILLLYYNGTIFQLTNVGVWWSWTNNNWASVNEDPRTVVVSASETTIPSATQIVDAQYNIWTVEGGTIYENGAVSPTTKNVLLLLYFNGILYQEALYQSADDWWIWSAGTWNMISGDPR